MAEPELFQTTFDVTVRKISYTFRIPGIQYDMQVGARAAAIRRLADSDGFGAIVDQSGAQFSRYCAILELFLESASDAWVFGGLASNPKDKPRVEHQKWPRNKINTVYAVGAAFETAFERFRDDGAADDDTDGGEAVAGSQAAGAP